MLLIDAEWQCQRCGEMNVLEVDPTGGYRQSLVEDCAVCCNPNVVDVVLELEAEDYGLVYVEARLE